MEAGHILSKLAAKQTACLVVITTSSTVSTETEDAARAEAEDKRLSYEAGFPYLTSSG